MTSRRGFVGSLIAGLFGLKEVLRERVLGDFEPGEIYPSVDFENPVASPPGRIVAVGNTGNGIHIVEFKVDESIPVGSFVGVNSDGNIKVYDGSSNPLGIVVDQRGDMLYVSLDNG